MNWLGFLGSPALVVAAVILLVNTTVAALFAGRNKYLQRRSRRLARIEPVHLDMMEWAYTVQTWAIRRGMRRELPPLPPSLDELARQDAAEPEPTQEQGALQSLGFPTKSSGPDRSGSGDAP